MNKIYRFIENSSKITFPVKNKTFCVKIMLLLTNVKLIKTFTGYKVEAE